jgi:hypothetical protein
MESVGLRSGISHYVEVRQQHISKCIVNQSIFNACRDGVRWDQPLSLMDDPPAGRMSVMRDEGEEP